MARRRSASSIRTRLGVALVVTAFLSVVLSGVLTVGMLRLASERIALGELRRQSEAVASNPGILAREPDRGLRLLRQTLRLSGAALYRLERDEWRLMTGPEIVPLDSIDQRSVSSGMTVAGAVGTGPTRHLFVARPVGRQGNRVVVLSRPAGADGGILGQVGARLTLAALLAVVVAATAAFVLARRLVGPLGRLEESAERIAAGDLGARVEAEGDDEIASLGRSFNSMAEALTLSDSAQRDFFLSVSHELRTPLTTIQGYAEAIEDGTVRKDRRVEAASIIGAESRRLSRLVSDLLDLARIDSRQFQVSHEEVEIDDLLEQIRRSFSGKSVEAGVRLQVDSEPCSASADPDRLSQVIGNLIENALRYTPAGGTVRLSAEPTSAGCRIQVSDEGPGFEQDDLQRAFERQYLWSKYKGVRDVGTGLGLAISKQLVEAMGGAISAGTAQGGGAEFTIHLQSS